MSDIGQRFIKRLSLEYYQNKPSIKIIDYAENKHFNKSIIADKKDTILQLYHVSRDPVNYSNIMRDGFYISSYVNNKGTGVYLANHGRYSAFWGHTGPLRHVLICNVIYNSNDVKRYRSEIYSPKHNSEYVVNNTKIIHPIGLLTYYFEFDMRVKLQSMYVKHGKFGCDKCDIKNKYGYYSRCDCELPGIDPDDIIN